MGSVTDKVMEINLSDDSGIDSPTGAVNAEFSSHEKIETLSDIIVETEEASVRGFEETAVNATEGGAYKAAGKIQSLCLLIFVSQLRKGDISILQQIYVRLIKNQTFLVFDALYR